MTAYFQYNSKTSLVTKTPDGTEIIVYLENGVPFQILMDDKDWAAGDDALYYIGAMVQDGCKPYAWEALAYLCIYAENEYPEIMAEAQREADNEARHEKSMSDSSRFI